MFEVDIRMLSYDAREFTIVDIGDAIRETKRYLETGKFLPVLVSKMENGRYKLRTSFITYFVAHCLEVATIPVQEIHANRYDNCCSESDRKVQGAVNSNV